MAAGRQAVAHAWLSRYGLWLLLGAYALLHLGFAVRVGPQALVDTPRYQTIADQLWNPGAWQAGDGWYASYALLLWLSRGSGWVVALVQVLAGAAALAVLVRAVVRGTASPLAGFAAGLLLLAFWDLQAFHWKLLTDSLFASGSTVWLLTYFQPGTRRWYWHVPGYLFLVFLRPVGVLLTPVVLVATLLRAPRAQRLRIAAGLGLLLLFILAALLPGFAIGSTWAEGWVVQGYEALQVTPPTGLAAGSGLSGLVSQIAAAPWFHMKVGALRMFWLLADVRPYWSLGHNAYNLGWLLCVYGLTMYGWRILLLPTRILLSAWIALHCLAVVLAAADWDGRFFLPLVGPLCALASAGVVRLVGKRYVDPAAT